MVADGQGTGDTGGSSGTGRSEANPSRPVVVDRRASSKIKYGELESSTDKATRNRLSNVRWPLGQEPGPDVEGTQPDDGWVNVKLEVTEHPAPDPNQRHLLGGGAEIRLRCYHCNEPLHIAAEKPAKEALEEAGYVFNKEPDGLDDAAVVACVCRNGHITQLRNDFVQRLIRRD